MLRGLPNARTTPALINFPIGTRLPRCSPGRPVKVRMLARLLDLLAYVSK
jgi:hypothetical protein